MSRPAVPALTEIKVEISQPASLAAWFPADSSTKARLSPRRLRSPFASYVASPCDSEAGLLQTLT